jgi:hypothetical protein
MSLEKKTTNDPIKKEMLKQYANEVTDKVVQSIQLPSNNTIVFGNSMYSGQIYKSSDNLLALDTGLQNNLPIFNFTQCETLLKKVYNITASEDLIYVTSGIDGNLNTNNSSSYGITVYDSITKKKLNLDYCNNITTSVEVPLPENSGINLTLYNVMKAQGIDILNPNDPVFTDRCMTFTNTSTGQDTTINSRRQNLFQQKTPVCKETNCTYSGINSNNYMKCECSGLDSGSRIVNQITDIVIYSINSVNVGIVTCYYLIPTVKIIII